MWISPGIIKKITNEMLRISHLQMIVDRLGEAGVYALDKAEFLDGSIGYAFNVDELFEQRLSFDRADAGDLVQL